MATNIAFAPQQNTVSISLTTSSANVALPALIGSGVGYQLRIFNSSTATAFIAFGQSGVTASTSTSLPMLPNSVEVFSIPFNTSYVAAIGSATNGTVYITQGEGL